MKGLRKEKMVLKLLLLAMVFSKVEQLVESQSRNTQDAARLKLEQVFQIEERSEKQNRTVQESPAVLLHFGSRRN